MLGGSLMVHRLEVFDRVNQAHATLLVGYSCPAVVTQRLESKGLIRRTAQRTFPQADALIREDIALCNVERTDLVAQAIH